MVKPNQGEVLDVDRTEGYRLFTEEAHLTELGFPLLESHSLRQARATRRIQRRSPSGRPQASWPPHAPISPVEWGAESFENP